MECKRALQRSLGLTVDNDACIISFVGRFTAQKGLDIIGESIERVMEDYKDGLNNVQLAMMGNGEECFRDMFGWAEHRWKGRVCGCAGLCPKVER